MAIRLYENFFPNESHSFFTRIKGLSNFNLSTAVSRKISHLSNRFSTMQENLNSCWNQKKIHTANQSKILFADNVVTPIISMESKKTLAIPYSPALIEKTYQKLIANKVPGVDFNKSAISTQKITEGLCTAITLTALRYMLRNKTGKEKLSKRLIDVANQFKNGTPQQTALIQSVFNSIRLEKGIKYDKPWAKMQSMAALFDLELVNSYQMIPIQNKNLSLQLRDQVSHLHDGTYCIRMIWPCQNEKEERVGHSLALLIEGEQAYLLDAGLALVTVPLSELAETLETDFTYWGANEVRFYRAELANKPDKP